MYSVDFMPDIHVDRTLNYLVQIMGGKESAHVIGACMVEGEFVEFGVTFIPGEHPIVHAGYVLGDPYVARHIEVKHVKSDSRLIRKAKQAVMAMIGERYGKN